MRNYKALISVVMTILLALSMFGCAIASTETTDTSETTTIEEVAEATDTAQAATEAPEETVKPVLLVVSFGTSYNDSRDITIGAIETALQEAYPDYEVRRAFTSQIIIDKLAERDGLEIDNVTEAMDRLVADGVKEVLIQPTHVMSGYEYDDVVSEVAAYQDQFDSFKIGKTLLTSDADYTTLINILVEETKEYNTEGTAVVFMGHGTTHAANATYAKLQSMITDAGYTNYYIGTVEATPSIEDVMTLVRESTATKVVLRPLMIVAGDHANNDMAGDEEDSWKTIFENAGFEVECVIEGLGQVPAVQQMIVAHAGEAMASEATVIEPAQEAAAPLSGSNILDGVYPITVTSSSSMFNVVKAVLTVENGEMSAVLTLSGQGYGKLYMGTGEEALADDESSYIPSVDDADGAKTFTVPVEALDQDTDCAAWSIKKETWYDRVLVFLSDGIPADAFVTE